MSTFEPVSELAIRRRTVIRMMIGGGIMSVGLVPAWPQNAEAALRINYKRTLKFGKVAGSSNGPGTCTITPAGVKQVSGYAIDLGKNHRAGRFQIRGGERNGLVQVTLPTTATLYDGASSATLHSFVASTANPVQLNKKGRARIDFGATMDIPANQPGGDFEGTFQIFVDEI